MKEEQSKQDVRALFHFFLPEYPGAASGASA